MTPKKKWAPLGNQRPFTLNISAKKKSKNKINFKSIFRFFYKLITTKSWTVNKWLDKSKETNILELQSKNNATSAAPTPAPKIAPTPTKPVDLNSKSN